MLISERVKLIRQATGLSQVKFAERIAVSSSYVADFELGRKPIKERMIRLICTEYRISEHWLRTGEGTMNKDKEDIAVAEVVSVFRSLPPSHQIVALSQINALAELTACPQE